MRLPIVHHPGYDAELPPTHRFPMSKYPKLIALLRERGHVADDNFLVPEPAGANALGRAHDGAYVEQVIACRMPRAVEREIGFAIDERTSRRARLASAGTAFASRLALEGGLALNAAGGSHHARRAQGAGFCTFNDVAVAALALLAERTLEKVLVLDLDVHQGDGTADIFRDDGRVFTVSVHGERNYPARKIASDLDVGLPDGTGDDAYLATLVEVLAGLENRLTPDIVFFNAGVDPHAEDRLGRLSLTDHGLAERDRRVIGHFRERGVALCGVIGGGYSMDVDRLAARHAILFDVAGEFV